MGQGAGRFVLISGCSGGGKSTLLAELGKRGYANVEEPGRRIVFEEMASDGCALPWNNLEAFATRAIAMAQADLVAARSLTDYVFFDRGLIDAGVALRHASGRSLRSIIGDEIPYARTVFFAPPWPEIYSQDEKRRHNFAAAVDECVRLETALRNLDYKVLKLPKIDVGERVDFVIRSLTEMQGINGS